jgi:phospholipid/cholesterol/gamma-HCH transport system substrate-binding protein
VKIWKRQNIILLKGFFNKKQKAEEKRLEELAKAKENKDIN